MEPLNNDMDDLFRKAGDHYPLRTSESEWEGVLGKLREETFEDLNSVPGPNAKSTRFKRRWLLMLLVIPIGLGSVVYLSTPKRQKSVKNPSITGHPISPKTEVDPEKNDENNNPGKNITADRISSSISGATDLKNYASVPPGISNDNENTSIRRNTDPLKSGHSEKTYAAVLKGTDDLHANKEKTGSGAIASASAQALDALPANVKPTHEKNSEMAPSVNNGTASAVGSVSKEIKATTAEPSIGDSSKAVVPPAVSKTKDVKKLASSKGFYIGILGGPDLSTIKQQSIKQTGFSLGVLVGYRFSKRFSLETGLMWDKKYYYSSGEYFDKNLVNLPPNENISNVNGSCNMFEIPLALRYDFATEKKHGFFVKAGLSSYLMQKENYSYLAQSYAGNPWTGDSTYYHSGNNILSIVQFSIGYEYAIDAKTKIRIEPYLKIPLQGVGISSMPISSAGLYIGISRSFR